MSLSNDFDKSRLDYLKKQIKNNENVAAHFYPRYQRENNEMFPLPKVAYRTFCTVNQINRKFAIGKTKYFD